MICNLRLFLRVSRLLIAACDFILFGSFCVTLPEPIQQTIEAPHLALAETPPTARSGLERRVLGLAAPVIGENLLQTMLGVVDTVLVAGLGAVALAGIGTALQVIFVLIGALSAPIST